MVADRLLPRQHLLLRLHGLTLLLLHLLAEHGVAAPQYLDQLTVLRLHAQLLAQHVAALFAGHEAVCYQIVNLKLRSVYRRLHRCLVPLLPLELRAGTVILEGQLHVRGRLLLLARRLAVSSLKHRLVVIWWRFNCLDDTQLRLALVVDLFFTPGVVVMVIFTLNLLLTWRQQLRGNI